MTVHEIPFSIREKSSDGSTPSWADKVGENFAEDFVAAFMPEQYGSHHKGIFGQPTDLQTEAFRTWAKVCMQIKSSPSVDQLVINGGTLLPDVFSLSDGQLRVQGQAGHNLLRLK